jgi:Phage integrase, N-terminal SAM-like domain
MEATQSVKVVGDRRTVEEAGQRLIEHLGALERKPTTLDTYGSLLRTHLAPHLETKTLDRIEPDDVERLIVAMRRGGAAPKTV